MQIYTYRELLDHLDGFDRWLDRLGVKCNRDRVNHAIDVLRQAENGIRSARKTGTPTKIGTIRDYPFGLVEALELHSILCAFENEPAETIRPKLVRMLFGPERPSEETVETSQGRNFAFELALAAEWRLAGARIEVGEPDITLWLDSMPFICECKRPFREESIRSNVKAAAAQLRNRLDVSQGRSSFGIVAISVARILNPGNKTFLAATEAGQEAFGNEVQNILLRNEPGWSRGELHNRVSAVLFHASTPADIDGRLVRMSYSVVKPIGREGPAFLVLADHLPRFYR